ncbi:winged helix-turn-helix domain-containing protein [Buttiauxella selenatireducens]|uniref:winged helix-turn-helix domain-containing protein n=1 Tax=Buttiauxella selenatireducens TaxID=3073902 RepID=UPI0035B51BE2
MRSQAVHAPVVEESVLQISTLQLDFLKHRVSRAGKRIELTQKEFLLLSLLMRRSGEVLSRTWALTLA